MNGQESVAEFLQAVMQDYASESYDICIGGSWLTIRRVWTEKDGPENVFFVGFVDVLDCGLEFKVTVERVKR